MLLCHNRFFVRFAHISLYFNCWDSWRVSNLENERTIMWFASISKRTDKKCIVIRFRMMFITPNVKRLAFIYHRWLRANDIYIDRNAFYVVEMCWHFQPTASSHSDKKTLSRGMLNLAEKLYTFSAGKMRRDPQKLRTGTIFNIDIEWTWKKMIRACRYMLFSNCFISR